MYSDATMPANQTIRSFKDLRTWQEAHRLTLAIHHATQSFPKREQYILVSQILRATISITSNIAEGFSKNTASDKINFYHIAMGSLTEVQNQLQLAKDLGYLPEELFQQLDNSCQTVGKMLMGLIKATRTLPSKPHNRPQEPHYR